MFSNKLVCALVILATNLTIINGQFGFGTPFFNNGGGSSGGFSTSNTNFNQNRGGSFGVVAGFGSGQSNTNFNQQNTNAGFNNFGFNRGGFRESEQQDAIEDNQRMHQNMRYASPFDTARYVAPKPIYKPAYKPAYVPAPSPPVQCGQKLLVGCAPQVQYVPCQSPPPVYY